MKFKQACAWAGISIISVLPVFLLFALGPGDYSSVTHTLGQIAGLVGMTMFALTLFLSTRLRVIEELFDGLDKVYPVHSALGAASFVLLLLHPLFLVMRFIPENFKLAAVYLLPGGLISVDFGIFALVVMIALLVVTLYANFKYNVWKISHEFLGLSFILASLHVILVREDVARDYIFRGYYLYAGLIIFTGLAAFFYSMLRTKIIGKKYKIMTINYMKSTYEILLEPIEKSLSFRAGQFVFVKFLNKSIGNESHPFSIASPSGNGTVRIIAKDLGDYTARLGYLKKGDMSIIEGPYGRFHPGVFADEIWIAGGIGITPFLGLAEDFRNNKSGHIDLYYSVKSRDEFVRLEELEKISRSNKRFRIYPWISNEEGYLTLQAVLKNSDLKDKEIYICGPESLKRSIKDALSKRKIPESKIHDERFAFK